MLKQGDKVKIKGNCVWFTEHLDGVIAEIIDVERDGYFVRVGKSRWYIPKENALALENE